VMKESEEKHSQPNEYTLKQNFQLNMAFLDP